MNNKSFIRMAGFSLLLVFVVCASLVRASSEPLERRGIARLMSFNNATDANLVKRGGRGTWYTGADLKNAACYDRNGLDPFSASPHDFIGAMAMNDFEECYKCMKITNNKDKNLSVIVKIVDKCAACEVGKAIDLTPGAFKQLAPNGDLDLGVLDISWKPLKKCPKSKLYPILPL